MKKNDNKGFRNIVFLGLVSCFADISSEMVYPIIPLYLTAVLGATPALVGVIEGVAESVASLLKVFSGYISDRFQKKKALAFAGYATGVFYKLALVFASSWMGILTARVLDRFGKGIRTAPRDVMVAESADKASMGKAFGVHKMLDMAGSAVGILLAFILLTTVNVALERPDLLHKIIADSFDGRTLNDRFSENLLSEREAAKANLQSRQFYEWCQGADWEKVVDLDTEALLTCAKEKRPLFHKPLEEMKVPILFMGSKVDEMCRENLEQGYKEMADLIPNTVIQMFEHGGHPAIATNAEKAAEVICNFILKEYR